jgi:hypothetical protein
MATGKWVSDGQMEFGSEVGILKVFLVCVLKTWRGLKEGKVILLLRC